MRKIPRVFKLIAVFMAMVILAASCASTTMIQSEPPGAKVYVDGEPMGKTPYTYTDTKIVGSVTHLKLSKEGYEDFQTVLVRNEEVDILAIIGGLIVWVPFLWVMKYRPYHNYELTPVD